MPREAPETLLQAHHPESVVFEDDLWQITCKCGWECWNVEGEEAAWDVFNDHVCGHEPDAA